MPLGCPQNSTRPAPRIISRSLIGSVAGCVARLAPLVAIALTPADRVQALAWAQAVIEESDFRIDLKEIGRKAAHAAEREAIVTMLGHTGGNKREAAERLGISYKAILYKKLDRRTDNLVAAVIVESLPGGVTEVITVLVNFEVRK